MAPFGLKGGSATFQSECRHVWSFPGTPVEKNKMLLVPGTPAKTWLPFDLKVVPSNPKVAMFLPLPQAGTQYTLVFCGC